MTCDDQLRPSQQPPQKRQQLPHGSSSSLPETLPKTATGVEKPQLLPGWPISLSSSCPAKTTTTTTYYPSPSKEEDNASSSLYLWKPFCHKNNKTHQQQPPTLSHVASSLFPSSYSSLSRIPPSVISAQQPHLINNTYHHHITNRNNMDTTTNHFLKLLVAPRHQSATFIFLLSFLLLLVQCPIPSSAQNDVFSVDMFPLENAKAHRTSAYEIVHNPHNPALVIRRGDPFYLALQMRRPYDPVRDKIRLEFMYGPRPLLGKKTLIYLPVTPNRDFTKDSSRWDARTHRIDGNVVTVQVHVPAHVAVGVWRMRVSTKTQGSRQIRSFDARERIYILFNAWCKGMFKSQDTIDRFDNDILFHLTSTEDPVYLEGEDRRREYVLNDVGKIYIGSHSKPKGRKWIYGQFAESVLPAVMFMLDKTRLDYSARSNPVKVTRTVAAMVNSHDDNGVLVGNWSGSYESGTPPWQWTSSAPILEQYLRTSGEPVKFGQCWVFAGVTTTVSKALGIPSRTVTNFVSAHDTDDSLTVDKFFDKSGETISDVNSDSIWNFHVWTDVWMARYDLPQGYSGWNVIDATPQETSDGLYRTGPASVESIRRGEIGLTYDSPFVFSEVNADVVHWELDERSEFGWKKIKTNKYHVGRKLFTKRIGFLDESPGGLNDAEDITHQYKNREGTDDERQAMLNAARKSGLSFLFELPFTSSSRN